MTLYVGTSGWAYPEWKPSFYPRGVGRARYLEHYARHLGACEVNATFYRVQEVETFERWRTRCPQSFRFAIKVHRRLTHSRKLAPDARSSDVLTRFVASLRPFGRSLGPLLLQLPPHRSRDDTGLYALLDALPSDLRCAVEFRHESWTTGDVATALAGRGATVCVSDTAGEVPAALPGGPFAYVRLRADHYDDRARTGWLALLRKEAQSRDVYVFAKHRDLDAGDSHGGVGLAQWLWERR
jgi:uncharacterized protein YecE (DUF72 family)